jgi:PAS domain S-box-containing protein
MGMLYQRENNMRNFQGTDVNYFCSESDLNGRYQYASHNFLEVDGHTLEEMLERYTSSIRDSDVPQYVLDEMFDWPRSKGFWRGVLKNIKKDGSKYWVKASIIRLQKDGRYSFGMISEAASSDEIKEAQSEYNMLRSIKYEPEYGRKHLRYPLYKDKVKDNTIQ